MRISIDGLAAMTVIGLAQLAILSLAFAASRTLSHRLFAGFATAAAMLMFGSMAMQTDLVRIAPHLAYLHAPTNFLLGPLFYFLACSVVRGSLPRQPLIHLLPALTCAVSLLPFYLRNGAEKLAALPEMQDTSRLRMSLLLIQAAAYMTATVVLLVQHGRQRRFQPLWMGTGAMTLVIPTAALRLLFGTPALAVPAVIAILATATSVYALRPVTPTAKPPRYSRSTLTPERKETSAAALLALFEHERPYLDPELSLESLAQRLRMPPSHLSQIVNDSFERTFRDWLNGWRIEEAKRRLLDPAHAHYSIAAIGESAGFGSKSAFHAAFRKETGTTPTEFRRNSSPESPERTS